MLPASGPGATCAGRDGWADPAPPARIFGNTYYVGTCGISVVLVTSSSGHILIDSGPAEAVPSVLANIRALGFRPEDVKYLIGSHEHLDHMGGFAALKGATGARLLLRAPARRVIESGKVDDDDPQAGSLRGTVPVAVDGVVADGQVIALGGRRLRAVVTPGHTTGGTSWTWRDCEGQVCRTIAYVDSLTAIAANGYRFSAHPARVALFRATFARVAKLDCDILVTPHPGASSLFQRLGGVGPLVERTACRRLADSARARFGAQLESEPK